MRLKRVIAVPFALLADVVTLGNMGDRSFTQQIFDAERREQYAREAREVAEVIARILEAARSPSHTGDRQ
jgi:hypothetical protein